MDPIIIGIIIGILLVLLLVIPICNDLNIVDLSIGLLAISVIYSVGLDIHTKNDKTDTNEKTYTGGYENIKYTDDFLKIPIGTHQEVKTDYSSALLEILRSQKMPKLCHLEENPTKGTDLKRLLDINDGIPYYVQGNVFRRILHCGRMKLFLSEVIFLTKVISDVRTTSKKEILFVYAGAAPGIHLEYLHVLFPQVRFELYDPNKFDIKENKLLKTHKQFYTDADAKYWRDYIKSHPNTYLAFCSDIRSHPSTDENIRRNMTMQLQWWKIMKPDLSMFKFRLPWEPGYTEYPKGDIYLQIFPSALSTETRLIVKKNAPMIKYDNTKYEEACFKHNTIYRKMSYNTTLGNSLDLQKDGLDNCYDCARYISVMEDYIKLTKSTTPLKQLLQDVEKNITNLHYNIAKHTIVYYQTLLRGYQKKLYYSCGNKLCKLCGSNKKHHKKNSKATLENEEKYMKMINLY